MDTLRYFALMIMKPVFFLSAGLRTNWQVVGGETHRCHALRVGGKFYRIDVNPFILRQTLVANNG